MAEVNGTFFYKRALAKNDGYISSKYPDLSDGGSEYLYVSGGNKNKRISIIQTKIPEPPTYGSAELSGIFANVYLNSVSDADGGEVYNKGLTKIFRTKEKTDYTEGSTTIDVTDIAVFTSTASDECISFYEGFNSANPYTKTQQMITDASTKQQLKITGWYITVEDAYTYQNRDVGKKMTKQELFNAYAWTTTMAQQWFNQANRGIASESIHMLTGLGQDLTEMQEEQINALAGMGGAEAAIIKVKQYTRWQHNAQVNSATTIVEWGNPVASFLGYDEVDTSNPPVGTLYWQPESGQAAFEFDAYFDSGPHIKPIMIDITRDVVTETTNTNLPATASKVNSTNSTFFNISNTKNSLSTNSNGDEFPIAFSDFVYTEEANTGIGAGMFMNLYNVPKNTANTVNNPIFENDPTPSSGFRFAWNSGASLETSTIKKWMQESKGSTGPFPAPVVQAPNTQDGDIWHKPKIEIDFKLLQTDLSLYFSQDGTAEGSGKKLTLRRSNNIFFSRYPAPKNLQFLEWMTLNTYNKQRVRGLSFIATDDKILVFMMEDCIWYSSALAEPYYDYRDAIGYIEHSVANDWMKLQVNCDMNWGVHCDIIQEGRTVLKNMSGADMCNIRLASRIEDEATAAITGTSNRASITEGDYRTNEWNYWHEARVHSNPEYFPGTGSSGAKVGMEAGLEYAWFPYLNFVSLNSRVNGGSNSTGTIEQNTETATAGDILGQKLRYSTFTGMSIDQIKASRFYLGTSNATDNAPITDKLTVVGNKVIHKPKTHRIKKKSTSLGDTENFCTDDEFTGSTDDAFYQLNKPAQNLIHLGFKNRSDIESASGKYLLFNSLTRSLGDVDTSSNVQINYSADSEYLGEVPNQANRFTLGANRNYSSSNGWVAEANASSSAGGKAVSCASFRQYWTSRDLDDDSDAGGTNRYYFPYGLDSTEFVSAANYNYTDDFNKHGLLKMAFDTTSESNLFTMKIGSETSGQSLEGGTYHKYSFRDVTNNPNINLLNGSQADGSFGGKESNRSGTYEFNMRRLNWRIYKSGGTPKTVARNMSGAFFTTGDIGCNADDIVFIDPGEFQKRENPFIQSNVLRVTRNDANRYTLVLDNANMITGSVDDDYLIYRKAREWIPETEDYNGGLGDALHTGSTESDNFSWVRQDLNHKYMGDAENGDENTNATICRIKHLGGDIVEIYQPEETSGGNYDDLEQVYNGLDTLLQTHEKDAYDVDDRDRGRFENMAIAISPYRYWLHIRHNRDDGVNRTVSSVCTVSGTGLTTDPDDADSAFHSTWNESQYTDAIVRDKPWTWGMSLEENSQLELTKDYGFGSYDATAATGGHVGEKECSVGSFNRIDLSKMVAVDKLHIGQEFSFVLHPSEPTDTSILQFYSSNKTGTTYDPYIETRYFDARPKAPNDFKVLPQEDRPFYPVYTWAVEDTDLWYGFLIVDSSPIESQYHGSVLHVPLNEEESVSNVVKNRYWRADQNQYIWSHAGTAVNTDNSTYSHLGLTGDGRTFSTTSYIEINETNYTQPTNTMSIIAHIVPSAVGTGTGTILKKGKEFIISYTSNHQIKVEVFPSGDTSSGAVPVTLTSTSVINPDGESPAAILVTLDTEIKNANVKLFINGKLEDQSGTRRTNRSLNNWPTGSYLQNHDGNLMIGRADSSNGFNGWIEEIVIYNTLIYPVVPSVGEFKLNKPFRELSSADEAVSITYVGRVFTKDYHNIRGANHAIGGVSPQVAFRKAAFALTTN